MSEQDEPGRRSTVAGPKWRQDAFTALTGRGGDVTGGRDADLRSMLTSAYGLNARGTVDTRSAAADLGVSQRTVQRWITSATEKTRPRPEVRAALAKQARKAATTRQGRKSALAGNTKAARHVRNGAKITITGDQGPRTRQYHRHRTVEWDLSGPDMQQLYAAYERGGDKAALSFLELWGGGDDTTDGRYVNDWFFSSIDSLDIR